MAWGLGLFHGMGRCVELRCTWDSKRVEGEMIDWRVERPFQTMTKRGLLLVRYGPRVALVKKKMMKEEWTKSEEWRCEDGQGER